MAKEIKVVRIRTDVYEIQADLEKIERYFRNIRAPVVVRSLYGLKRVNGYRIPGATIFKHDKKVIVIGDIHRVIKHLSGMYKSYKFKLSL